MAINKELSEEELKNVIGTSIPADKLPNKFKKTGEGDMELTEDDLERVLGTSIPVENLPDWAYSDKDDTFSIEKDGTIVRK